MTTTRSQKKQLDQERRAKISNTTRRVIKETKGDKDQVESISTRNHSSIEASNSNKMDESNTSQDWQLAINELRDEIKFQMEEMMEKLTKLILSNKENNTGNSKSEMITNPSKNGDTSNPTDSISMQVLQAINYNNLIEPFDGTDKDVNIKSWFTNLEKYFKLNNIPYDKYVDHLSLKLKKEPLEVLLSSDAEYTKIKEELILLYDTNKSIISAERELDALTKPIDKIQELEKRANKIKELSRTIYQGRPTEERLKAQSKKLWSLLKPGIRKLIKLPTKYDDFDWELFILEIKQTFEIEMAETRERKSKSRKNEDNQHREKKCKNIGCKYPYNHETEKCRMPKPKSKGSEVEEKNNLIDTEDKDIDLLHIKGEISNIPVVIAIDSGSTFTSISKHLQDLLRMGNKIGSETKIKLIDGITTIKRAKGKRTLKMGDKLITLKDPMIFNTSKHNFDILLGRDILKKYGAIIDHRLETIRWTENTPEQHLNFLITPSNSKEQEYDRITFSDLEVRNYGLSKELVDNHIETNFHMRKESIHDSMKQLELDEYISKADSELRKNYSSVFICNDAQIIPTLVAEKQNFNFTKEEKSVKTYGLSYHNQKIALQLAKIWEQAGIIQEGEPDNGITHPVIIIDKMRGEEIKDNMDITSRYRLVCDFRNINKFTVKHSEIAMNITNSILINRPFVFCSKLDFKTAYGQIKLHPSNTKSFNITIGHKKFNYLTLPQGAKNSSTLFKIVMMNVFKDLFEEQKVQWYHDDMLIMTHADPEIPLTLEIEKEKALEHFKLLKIVLQRMKNNNIKVSQLKSQLFQKSVNYLGFTLTRTGWHPSIQSVNRILNRGRPDSKESLRRFLYASNYFSCCIPNFSTTAACLYELVNQKTKTAFQLLPHHQKAYNHIVQSLCNINNKLYFGNPNKDYIIRVDASNTGIGGSISQIIHNIETNTTQEYPLGFISFRLPKITRRRSSTYLELKGIAAILEYYKFLLENVPGKIRIYTDHRPLQKLRDTATLSKHVELLSHIDKFNCEFIYEPGKNHVLPDWLSRMDNNESLEDDETKGYDDSEQNFETLTCLFQKRKRGRPRKQINENETHQDTVETTDNFLTKIFTQNVPFSREELIEEQSKDYNCKQAKERGYFMNYEVRTNENNILQVRYPKSEEERDNVEKTWRTLIPLNMAEKVIKMYHEFGHFAFLKTLASINSSCYIPQPGKIIKKILKCCETCNLRNPGQHSQPSHKTIELSHLPFENLSIDIIIPKTVDKNCSHRYILVAVDECTKFVWIIPLHSKSSNEINEKLIKYIYTKGGIPKKLRTDGDGQFRSQDFIEMGKQLGIKEIELSTAYDSNSNSLIENRIKTTNKILYTLMEKYPNISYCKLLDLVAYYQNNSAIIGMNMTPTEMLFGVKPRTILSDVIDSESTSKFIDRNNDINEILNSFALIRRIANDEQEKLRMMINERKPEKKTNFEVGEKFYLKQPRKHKFDKNYSVHEVWKDLRTKVLYKNKEDGKVYAASKAKIKKV
ncbi:Reverse transcriptase domain and Integrase, catalytic core domain and Ribonuclease H-like domain and Aspartic peptidase domain-containing protein [Strongyloides ratti]|uniref:RNA-directed DNA polymerase n=1 Tax=Strongyloides ratti TaxID=34506 RepID=A0A090N050_STRRB|nr:Reverse transcriptase domain and Integrase,catalytic core domain and Ribonuclease H-like domain and Aspartic peptidase domain-containing protein [Strongyloides ratti]XP_024509269.1 Reverse transcriptase domain and Integrase, catalytic core domain and Ribonuclease H-like domain and Aspartic peptidase domain-containing protein [Strongyloides ratti]CEF60964.1 Reverse transcriptase domain and Integrase,catalytic core domain and Ribonuclease H-like domain and Aspartic peptidase domain-containing pr